jgi:hypothetical protein
VLSQFSYGSALSNRPTSSTEISPFAASRRAC